MTSVVMTPAALAQVETTLAQGPPTNSTFVDIDGGAGCCRIAIRWLELPKRLAAAIALIGGVLWLIVSPTAPDAAAHARQLLRTATTNSVVVLSQSSAPMPGQPTPHKRRSPVTAATPPPEELRRRDPGSPTDLSITL